MWLWLVCGLFGSLIALLQASKGTFGFQRIMEKLCKTERKTMLASFILGILIFVDDYLNVLTVGVCMKGLYDRKKVPRESWPSSWIPPVLRCVYCFRFLRGLYFMPTCFIMRHWSIPSSLQV